MECIMNQTSNEDPIIFSTSFIFGADELALGIRNLILNSYFTSVRFSVPIDTITDNDTAIIRKSEKEVLDNLILAVYIEDIALAQLTTPRDVGGIWQYLGELDPHNDFARRWLKRTAGKILVAYGEGAIKEIIQRVARSFTAIGGFTGSGEMTMTENLWVELLEQDFWIVVLYIISFSPEIIRFNEYGQWKREF